MGRTAVRSRHLLEGVAGQFTLTVVVVVAIFAGVLPRIADQASTSISTTVPLPLGLGAWLLWSHGAGRVTTSSEPAGVAS